jgi:hypothetical protein
MSDVSHVVSLITGFQWDNTNPISISYGATIPDYYAGTSQAANFLGEFRGHLGEFRGRIPGTDEFRGHNT